MTMIDIIIVAASTLFIYWALGMAIYWVTKENENFAAFWCMGLVYWILYAICTPVRLIRKYCIRKG